MRCLCIRRNDLATQLGGFTPDGVCVQTSEAGLTTVPDVYAGGDRAGPFQQAVVAAARGIRAAAALNNELV